MRNDEVVWNVSDVNSAVRDLVENSLMPFWLRGEVSSLTLHRSGHAYMNLKDARTSVRAVFFNGAETFRNMNLGNGSLIECHGRLTVYEVRGEYQFSIRTIRPAGLGELQRRFEELKKKLDDEGLFDPARKRPIPLLPRRIGVVTSPTGAAVKDFLRIIERRFPRVNVRIYPAQVQGASAAAQVVRGIEFFNRTLGADVIVVTRGGGSMEDLWPFNDEKLARTIAASAIPVISAVGHEIDFTIADFAADLRVPTPSAAAELVIGSYEELIRRLEHAERNLVRDLESAVNRMRIRLDRAANHFVFKEFLYRVEQKKQQLDDLSDAMERRCEKTLQLARFQLEKCEVRLSNLDPAAVLERGYAILFDRATQRAVTSIHQKTGAEIEARVTDGTIHLRRDQ